MLSKEIREDLEDRCKARIMFMAPYIAENSDGVPEQYYQVNMMDDTTTFYINVDTFGAVCGGEACRYDVETHELI